MVHRSLVRHWTGMSKDDIITERWTPEQREGFDEFMASSQQQIEEAIVESISRRAKGGDTNAFDWLESRGLISKEGRRSDMFVMLEHIAKQAEDGELDAVEWLEKRGLIKLPSKTTD